MVERRLPRRWFPLRGNGAVPPPPEPAAVAPPPRPLREAFARPAARPCPQCGGLGFHRRDVSPTDPAFGEAFPCECTLLDRHRNHMQRLNEFSRLEALQGKSFVNFDPGPPGYDQRSRQNLRKALTRCAAFARQPAQWLFLQGGHGVGKTHLVAAIANQLRARDQPVLFMTAPDLLDRLRATFEPESQDTFQRLFHFIGEVAVLILDDLGAHASTPWVKEKLFQLLNQRYLESRPTVITSNRTAWDFEERIQSRLSDARVVECLFIDAPDYRSHGSENALGRFATLDSFLLHQDKHFSNFKISKINANGGDGAQLKNARELARQYAQNPSGWLVLTGPHGCGKTHLAAAVANMWRAPARTPLFADFADLQDFLRNALGRERGQAFETAFNHIRRVPFLVVDDYAYRKAPASAWAYRGSEKGEWIRSKIKQLLEYRFYAHLPTVITLSLRAEEIEEWFAARMSDDHGVRTHCVEVKPFLAASAPPARRGRA